MSRRRPKVLPKLNGLDAELGNFILGLSAPDGSGREASRALLRQIDGLPQDVGWAPCWCPRCMRERTHASSGGWGSGRYNVQDWGRKYLASNGGCVYIDLDHLELCIPEVVSAWDHVAAWHAMLRVARQAQVDAARHLPEDQSLQVLVNNSDGRGNSYGSHLSFLISRLAWEHIFSRRIHYMLFLAAYQVSSIVFTGQGKAGSENGAPPCGFALTQRGDFFEVLTGEQTTYRRPIVNARDESLCGPERSHDERANMARLHVIFYDANLCQVATLLKVGVLQIILSLLEAGWVDADLMLEEPLQALTTWNHDPELRARARLLGGERLTAVALQRRFLALAQRFAATGALQGAVPRHAEILALWADTLDKLETRDWQALAPRLDWVLKRTIVQTALARRPDLDWDSPEIKHLDHMYASLDPTQGLYWHCAAAGQVETVVPEARIAHFTHHPPTDTRAWMRSLLLRSLRPQQIDSVDWDRVRIRTGAGGCWNASETICLDNPLAFTQERFAAGLDNGQELNLLLARYGRSDEPGLPETASRNRGERP